jgi:glycosidase
MLKKAFVLILALALVGCHELTPSPTPPSATSTITSTNTPEPTPSPTLAPTSTLNTSPGWWKDGIFYLIFVRSFYDSNNDGIGDFNGITQKLDYLNDGNPDTTTDLGINAIWLMPIMDSPSEHGYDVRDFYKVNPQYGTLEDFKELLTQAHKRGIHVIIDFILHNASEQNDWFVQSRDPSSPYRTWFLWSAKDPGWRGPWGQQVWYPLENAFFYSYFWKGSPSLNVANPDVTAEIKKITDYWVNDIGVDGFRLDAIGVLIPEGSNVANTPSTHRWLKDYHTYLKSLDPSFFTVGEIWDKNEVVLPYVQDEEIDLAFNFDLAFGTVKAIKEENPELITGQVVKDQQTFPDGRYGLFLANHDMDRLLTQLDGNAQQAKAAASVYLTLPGVPFIYYGEEIGMQGYAPDSGGRLPMQWTGGQNAGFSQHLAWLPPGAGYETLNVQNEQGKPLTLLTHYQKLITLRNRYEVIRRGEVFIPTPSQSKLYSTFTVLDGEAVLVIINLSSSTFVNVKVSLPSSSLPAGEYQMTDLFGSSAAQQVVIDSSGGYASLAAATQILPWGTLIFHLSKP